MNENKILKLLVVDDEVLARNALVRALRKFGYDEIHQADDGMTALDIILKIRPEIVLADIRMPGMDGIELLSKVKEYEIESIFIFISGYDFFEYAQKAISLGAFGYLLKPVYNDELESILTKAVLRIEHHKSVKNESLKKQVRMDQGIEYMKRNFLQQSMSNVQRDLFSNCDKLSELGLEFPYELFVTLIISLDSCYQTSAEKTAKEIELIVFLVENITTEVLSVDRLVLQPFHFSEGLGYLINYPKDHKYSRPLELYALCCEVLSYINVFINESVTIGVGLQVETLSQINLSYQSAINSLSQKAIKGINHVYLFKKTHQGDFSEMMSSNFERQLSSALERDDSASVVELIKSLYNKFKVDEFINPNRIKKLNLQMIMLIYRLSDKLGLHSEIVLGDELVLYNEVALCKNIDEIVAWFERVFDGLFLAIKSKISNGHKSVSERVKSLIDQSNGNLTLENAANYVHINPSYFSRLFKAETGQNYIDYLLQYRISKAKDMLMIRSLKIAEICTNVGFHDIKHFYKVFKRYTGYTPTEYRTIWYSDPETR